MPVEPKCIYISWLNITKASLICKYSYKNTKTLKRVFVVTSKVIRVFTPMPQQSMNESKRFKKTSREKLTHSPERVSLMPCFPSASHRIYSDSYFYDPVITHPVISSPPTYNSMLPEVNLEDSVATCTGLSILSKEM